MIIISIVIVLFIVLFILVISKHKIYKYNQKQDYIYDFKNPKVFELDDINLEEYKRYETLILKLKLKSNFLSKIFLPYLEISNINKKEKTFFEYGLNGIRYIDISSFAGNSSIKIDSKMCKITSKKVEIFSYDNLNIKEKKVLIIAPHPDDAEISSFGLYNSAKESYIITVTAGEGSSKYCDLENNSKNKAILKGKLRKFNALTTSIIGGVKYENNLILGYFDGTIKNMFNNKNKCIPSKSLNVSDISYFRQIDNSKIPINENSSSMWESLVDDFKNIVDSINPDLIFTLHPRIDSHPDHQYTTLALLEAMEILNKQDIKILTSTNHLIYNEFYPYGDMFSTIPLVPKFDNNFIFNSIYSHQLTKEQQIYKYYALETMHDLREPMINIGIKRPFQFAFKQLKRYINGKDKSYYRRAVKTNEIFYITNIEELKKVYKEMGII
ncbi:PIG-L family deacetylase [Aliarcobacter cryaerophilus]|uniref:PIG-L family deacetylase n=1 Tax=Aliarcobacter cryaerophilus TaxID=28198 RepID=UPI0021B24DAA|nr:PIG-L family deacetylase [Aliarcobacter cryaerophilus]MCT7484325.1 PIG-L family deacetylase [Aliarcobacter cryaerophilus]